MRVEVLVDPLMHKGGARMLDALIEAAPMEVKVSTRYTGSCDLLVTYGTGHPVRRPWWQRHRASGKHCIGWDLGYWDSERGAMRATIDEDHPQAWIRPESPERWDAQGIPLREDGKAEGPAVIVGLGHKSLGMLGLRPLQWESAAADRVKAMGLQPVFKPKRQKYHVLPNVTVARGTMEETMKGAAMVMCRHSNAAVDACIAGVPVMCEDGAAYALYKNNPNPTSAQRLEFLRSLAWWQWKPEEAKQAWTYQLNRLFA
jgi:hypothetical protein